MALKKLEKMQKSSKKVEESSEGFETVTKKKVVNHPLTKISGGKGGSKNSFMDCLQQSMRSAKNGGISEIWYCSNCG